MDEQDLQNIIAEAKMDPSKPIMLIQVNGFAGYKFISAEVVKTMAKVARLLKAIYHEKYNVVMTTDQMKIVASNVIQLNFDERTDYNHLLELLDKRVLDMMKEREENEKLLHDQTGGNTDDTSN